MSRPPLFFRTAFAFGLIACLTTASAAKAEDNTATLRPALVMVEESPAMPAAPVQAVVAEPAPSAAEIAAVTDKGLYKPWPGPFQMTVTRDLGLVYPEKKNGLLQVRVTYPAGGAKLPVIVWSHGALGSQYAYEPLVSFWASHGYAVIQPTHPDSLHEEKSGGKGLLVFKDWDKRPAEVSYILDNLDMIEQLVPALKDRLDRDAIGMGGHSFGAQTAQLLAGATTRRPLNLTNKKRRSFVDARPLAFVMVSPQGTSALMDKDSFATMDRPFLMVTGTKDASRHNGKDYLWRLESWRYAPAHDKHLLFIDDAWHGFGGIAGKQRFPGSGPDDDGHVSLVRSTALALFDAELRRDPLAAGWLDSATLPPGAQLISK